MKNTHIIISFFLLILITGCNPKFYSPNTQNVPLISEKGETNLTLSANGNQVEFQGAHGITDAIAIQANGGLFIPSDLDNGDGGSGKFFEVGVGYYTPVAEGFVFETYGLIGFGNMENHFPSKPEGNTGADISSNIIRFGIQPNFGYKSKYFSAAVSSRFVNLMYTGIEGDLIFGGENQVEYLEANKSNFLIEPALTLRGGLERLKLQLQIGYSLNLSNSDFKQDKTSMTLGLNFNFK